MYERIATAVNAVKQLKESTTNNIYGFLFVGAGAQLEEEITARGRRKPVYCMSGLLYNIFLSLSDSCSQEAFIFICAL
jgi:hypothetical protein